MIAAFAHAALAICAALAGSLWEGIPIVAAVWLALRFLPNLGAATRYAAWLCALAALLVVPVVTAFAAPPRAAASAPAETAPAVALPALTMPATKTAAKPMGFVTKQAASSEEPIAASIAAQPAPSAHIDIPQTVAVAIALAWILAACMRAVLLLKDLRELAALRRGAAPWSNADGYPISVSSAISIPLAVGFLDPAVILPTSLTEEFSRTAIDAVVAHELAHLRRLDVWTNALARVIEVFLVFNPLAWLVVRRLSIEREIACDDWVVARSNGGEIFARTLATIAGRTCARTPLAAPSALGSRHAVVERIERLLEAHPRRLRPSLSALGGVLAFIAIAAFVLQSVSPVFAYAPEAIASTQSGSGPIAGPCLVPNRPIQLSTGLGLHLRHPENVQWYPVEDADKIVAHFTAAKTAVVDLTVDAKGAPQVTVVSAPPVPGLAEFAKQLFMHDAYEPALRNCVAVASTVRTAVRIEAVVPNSLSLVAPSYPDGWTAAHPTSCKVPNLLHTGVPEFPSTLNDFPIGSSAKASARVTVDASGKVTSAAIVATSGRPAFDSALLEAARSATYPLTESTGFKPVRPSNATLAWNAANGSSVYSKCTPWPGAYVWNTTFKKIVDRGAQGSTADVSLMQMNF